ncbi:FUSC family protein [Demequina sp. NBRC 110051]|uniref:FUSC family protein n=1 Tax=Demequina sp. NBRC 110051 TaxID=1570340 RepID=UPI000A013DD3|nr:FUSC family protein [Demequina sp. NBRC 110051]
MSSLSTWLPPSAVVRLVCVIVAAAGGIGAVVWWWGGPSAGVASVLGVIAVLMLALRRPPATHVLALGVIVAVGSSGATLVAPSPWGLAAVVAASVLATFPLVLRHGAVVSSVPVVVALAGTDAVAIGPEGALAGILLAAVLTIGVVRLLRLRAPAPPTPSRRVLVVYLGAVAFGSALAAGLIVAWEVPHGVWVIVALSAVLLPVAGETVRAARARVLGTVVGTVVASAASMVLPAVISLALVAVLLVWGIAWIIAKNQARGAGFVAAAVVLIAGVSTSEAAWEVAGQRALLTLVGGLAAVALGLIVARLDRSWSQRAATRGQR